MRHVALASVVCVLASCSGGDSPGLAVPTVACASFVGVGPAPAAGDTIVLLFSRDVSVTGSVLDDSDISLSSGSLGVGSVPVLLNSRSVQITLGAGASFTPGTTTIAVSGGNDAIIGANGIVAVGGTPRTISTSDGDAPTASNLTLNDIGTELNGLGAAGGTLQVPLYGFTIVLEHTDPTSTIDTAATQISFDVSVDSVLGPLPAGTNVAGLLTRTTVGNKSTYTVPQEVVLALGSARVSAVVVDSTGMGSAPVHFDFATKTLTDPIRPFETTQLWFLDLSRDVESFSVDLLAAIPLVVTAGANGRSDLEDAFLAIGVLGSDASVNATMMSLIKAAVTTRLGELFAGCNISFTFTSPGTFPAGLSSVDYSTLGWSQMCIAGAATVDGGSSTLGLAIVDPNNATQNDDCILDFQGSRLGVFWHTEVNSELTGAASNLFRVTFDPLTPARGGTPVGDDAQDAARLAGTVTDARETTLSNAISRVAAWIGYITAHECGHSLGLVRDGAMPDGLFGNDTTNFAGSTSNHIEMSGFFPGAAQNVMSPSGSFEAATAAASAFNTINLAYLREQVLYNN